MKLNLTLSLYEGNMRRGKVRKEKMKLNLTLSLYEGNMRRGKVRKGMGKGMGDDGVVVELGREDEERKRP